MQSAVVFLLKTYSCGWHVLDSLSMQKEFYDESEVAQNGLTAGGFLDGLDTLFFIVVCLFWYVLFSLCL